MSALALLRSLVLGAACLAGGSALAQDTPAQPAPVPAPRPSTESTQLEAIVERLDLREVPLREALRMLSEESGVNLVPSEKAGDVTVSTFMQNASLRSAIEALAKSYGLWFREEPEIDCVRVMTTEEYRRDLTLFRDERTRVLTLFYPNSLEVALAIRNLFGGRVRLSLDRETQTEEYSDISQRFQKFDLLDRRTQGSSSNGNYGNYGYGQQGYFGSGTYGINGGYGSFGSNYGNYGGPNGYGAPYQPLPAARSDTETPELTSEQLSQIEQNLRENKAYDAELMERLRGEQATIFVSILRKNNQIAVRSGDTEALDEIERIVRALDVPTPQVLLEVKILNLDLGDEFQSAFDFEFSDSHNGLRFNPGSIADGTGLIDPGALVYSFVDGNFLSRLQLLEQERRVSTLATPLLLVANNEVARLFIGEERPIVQNVSSQTVVNSNVSTTAPNTTFELRPVGTTLLLTPNINADRTVTLRVLQETSDVRVGGATIPIITGDGDVVQTPIDVVATRTVTGTVVAKDGLALALGGLIEEGVMDQQSGVPFLKDLPLVGILFRRDDKQRTRRELVVIIRPRVLFTADEGQRWSRDLADRLLIHPSSTEIDLPLGTFTADEAPRPPLGTRGMQEAFMYQAGLPDGR